MRRVQNQSGNDLSSADMISLKERDRRHHVHTATNPVKFNADGPTMYTHAKGVHIYTDDGRQIIDAGSGLSNVNIGYGNQRVCDAAYHAMQQLSYSHVAGGCTNPWAASLSEKLAAITPTQYQHFYFSTNGSDAMETALKMAWNYWRLRGQPGKRALIAREGSYHGNTIMAASLSGIDAYKKPFGLPITDRVHHIESPYWYRHGQEQSPHDYGLKAAAALEQKIREVGKDNIAAFIAEPITAAVDMFIPPDSYWPEIRRICDANDILLIADEIITGFGKTGQWFGFQNFGYEPDLFVMAKGLASGYFPISSVGIGKSVSQVLQGADEVFAHIFTNCGHPVGAAVALENIAIIEEQGLVERVREGIGPYFAQRLEEFKDYPCVGEVRTFGVLGAVEIDMQRVGKGEDDSKRLNEKINTLAWNKGLTLRASGLVLPMIITHQQIDEVINILKESFDEALDDL